MANIAGTHYESLFAEQQVYRPHPYTDVPHIIWDNWNEPIPRITVHELLKVIRKCKKKHSQDAHGISSYMLNYILTRLFVPILDIFNESIQTGIGPPQWKIVRMKLLPKRDAICNVNDTRPISLLDTFLKILERLMLNRLQKIIEQRGNLNDSHEGTSPIVKSLFDRGVARTIEASEILQNPKMVRLSGPSKRRYGAINILGPMTIGFGGKCRKGKKRKAKISMKKGRNGK